MSGSIGLGNFRSGTLRLEGSAVGVFPGEKMFADSIVRFD